MVEYGDESDSDCVGTPNIDSNNYSIGTRVQGEQSQYHTIRFRAMIKVFQWFAGEILLGVMRGGESLRLDVWE